MTDQSGDRYRIQTVDGRDFLVVVRRYDTAIECFGKLWKSADVVKVNWPLIQVRALFAASKEAPRH